MTHERLLEMYPLKRRVLEVAEVERVTPRMIRVHLEGPDLEGLRSDHFADHVKLWFPNENGDHVLPIVEDDPRLEPGFEATGDEDVDQVALWELGLGRPRVLSRDGREDAAGQRGVEGERHPRRQQRVPAEQGHEPRSPGRDHRAAITL